MKREDRKTAIMDLLVAEGEVQLDLLADRFAVSRMTVHRDLDDLEDAGLLRKIRGGATIQSGTQFESDFRFRERQSAPAKAQIANAALQLVEPGMTVLVNDGSMAAILGSQLIVKRPLTVVTNNGAIIDALRSEPGITLISLGGTYSAKYNAFFGKLTQEALSNLRADLVFISTPAVSGTSVFHMDENVVHTKRAMINAASSRVLLVNHSRFGQTALHRLADLSEFDHIITDATPDSDAQAALDASGLSLTIAPPQERH